MACLLLASESIDIHVVDKYGCTALYVASYMDCTVVMRLLLLKGAVANATAKDGVTPLIVAASHGHHKAVRLLLAVPGIDTNAVDNWGRTALVGATCVEVVRQLVAVPGVNVNAADNLGNTLLHDSARCGYLDVVALLLKVVGVDVNVENKVAVLLL